ncbi:SprT family zinc-dependent metalloprotease [Alteromonadaceae bacterium M269]|nr:SprT family zinc-dependent metalloprotease [Alteromonadaceae bacterium M269]
MALSLSSSETNALLDDANQCVRACYEIAESVLGQPFVLPTITLNQRGKIAGCAKLQQNHLRLNASLFKENKEEFLDVVIPHEVCHLLTYQLYGRVKPHGREWKGLMNNLYGLPGKATHSMDVSSVSQATFPYRCNCGPVELTIRRHKKVQKGVQYFCRRCKTQLEPI